MLSELMLVQDILIAAERDRSTPAHVVAVVRCPHTVKVSEPCWGFCLSLDMGQHSLLCSNGAINPQSRAPDVADLVGTSQFFVATESA